jgi:hypothetical protein
VILEAAQRCPDLVGSRRRQCFEHCHPLAVGDRRARGDRVNRFRSDRYPGQAPAAGVLDDHLDGSRGCHLCGRRTGPRPDQRQHRRYYL